MENWNELYNNAIADIKQSDECKSAIIEIVPESPLLNGFYPNDDYEKILLRAIDLRNEILLEYELIKFFIQDTEEDSTKVKLSKSGMEFLICNGISENDIIISNKNLKEIHNETNTDKLYVVTISSRVMRKALESLKQGILPDIIAEGSINGYTEELTSLTKYI